tara:strand:+ start:398 stop:577 length:180 start_codon:yes stop_codon:yes gene_type:complete
MKKLSELPITELTALRNYWIGKKSDAYESHYMQNLIQKNNIEPIDKAIEVAALKIHYDK